MISSNQPDGLIYPPTPLAGSGVLEAIRSFGPGAIIASVTIGSGETLFASRAGAIFGYDLLWFIVLAITCKFVQVYTAGRYMVLAGEHPMEAWARLPGPRGWFPARLGALSVVCFPFWMGALAMMLGTAVNWVIGIDAGDEAAQWFYAQLFATATLALAMALTLVQSYQVLEKVQTGIVVLLLVAILTAVVLAPVDWLQAVRGVLLVKMPAYAEWMSTRYPGIVERETVLLSMVIFMAALGGGTYDYIGYLSFFRQKGWGALGCDKHATDHTSAPVIEQTEANLAAGRRWLRAPLTDVLASFLCVLVFTIAFSLLGAALLHPKQVVPDKFDLLTPQAEFLTRFGAGFKVLYQAGILMAFWGTIYGALEIYSRTAYECFRPLTTHVRRMSYVRFRLPVCLYAGIIGSLLAWTVTDPLDIIRPIVPVATLTCGIWCYAMIWADRKVLPPPLRMNRLWLVLNLLAGAALAGFGVRAIWD